MTPKPKNATFAIVALPEKSIPWLAVLVTYLSIGRRQRQPFLSGRRIDQPFPAPMVTAQRGMGQVKEVRLWL
jgi:hypothetical protein